MSFRPRALIFAILTLSSAAGVEATDSATAGLSDAELEQILREGKITRKEDIGTGVTLPTRLWIEMDGVTLSASHKDVNYEKKGLTRFTGGDAELNFTDSYKYERAAYLVDRAIGLDMVPVTVIRRVYRNPGAVSLWIGNSISEMQRVEQGLRPPNVSDFVYQQGDMRIFDALIYNTDRHAQNQLFTLGDWRLHLIDHSRAFRVKAELPASFIARPLSISRDLLAALEALNEPELKKLLKRELGPSQIRGLLIRRNLILQKLQEDRLEYGDAFAFRQEQVDR